MSTESIQQIQALSSIITSILGICGLGFALYQIWQIKTQLRTSALTNVLSLEAEMNSRKEKLDNINHEISMLLVNPNPDKKIIEVFKKKHSAAIENWLNSVDRLCFCIKRDYLKEKDWKIEYRDYIINIVKTFEPSFGPASKYKNIIDIKEKWSRE